MKDFHQINANTVDIKYHFWCKYMLTLRMNNKLTSKEWYMCSLVSLKNALELKER
jgi:hypothetical protein